MATRIKSTARSGARKPRKTTPDAAGAPGTRVDLTAPGESSAPLMPHERDQDVGMTGGVQSEVVQQGARDLKRGLQDTSRAPEANRAYEKLKK